MGEFNLKDLEAIGNQPEIIKYLVDKGIIKQKKFLAQLDYELKLDVLQYEMLKLQQHIIQENKKLLIIFEGRDAAGKGGTIKRVIQKLNPKEYRVIALPKPSENQQKQWYFQRYIEQFPKEGEIVFFDRSWYNRAVVEPVFGFCSEKQHEIFMKEVLEVENMLQKADFILIKFHLSISKEEQKERLDKRKNDPLKQYKIGKLDQKAQEKWEDYSFYINKMLEETGTKNNPWVEVRSDSKKESRLACLQYLLNQVDGFQPAHSFPGVLAPIQIH